MEQWNKLLTGEQQEKLHTLLSVFLEENKKLNLSAYRTREQCWVGNVVDSVAALPLLFQMCLKERGVERGTLKVESCCRVIDVGTGGGFPLLPLAILLSNLSFTGIDATRKKIDAVERMVGKLGLQNVELKIGRAETLGHDEELRGQFDVVLSRAVAELSTLLEYCSPFARIGARVICWKTLSVEEELQASLEARMQLQCRLMDRSRYDLDALAARLAGQDLPLRAARPAGSSRMHLWGERQLLIFEKTALLGEEFPRKVGTPLKHPLGETRRTRR